MCIYMDADDKIVVLDYGHLKEHGSGAELIDMEDGARLTKHTHLLKDTHLQQNTQPTKKTPPQKHIRRIPLLAGRSCVGAVFRMICTTLC
jgi:hypothetical protein